MRQLKRTLLAVVLVGVASGCFLWRSEKPRQVARPDFPPPLDAKIDGALIWAEAHPNAGSVPLTVFFNVEPLEDAQIETWAWDFGDGTPIARQRLPQHVYSQAGTFEAFVWGRDRHGRISMDTVKIRVDP